jgi:pimeloyl-ACP methyl ester carboxylesterase
MKNYRTWGKPPYTIAVVHGGPGAPGSVAPVARELSKDMGILEPLQTKDSIDGQIEELVDVLKKYADIPVVLIGHSWGATLSYLTAARFPNIVKKLILIGMPPLSVQDRPDLTSAWLNRLSEAERVDFLSLEKFVWDGKKGDKSASMGRLFRLITKGESYALIKAKDEVLEYRLNVNVAIFRELTNQPQYLDLTDLGKAIKCHVVAIHGNDDPRPAKIVREPLSKVIKGFKFMLLDKCGHTPWMEKHARKEFFKVLSKEIV